MKENNSHGQLTAQIDLGSISKNGFNLDHSVYGTGRLGRLIPIHFSVVNAGDTMNVNTDIGVQFEPLAVPTLNNMYVKQEQFYVPKNVVWQDWDKFLSSGENLDYEGKEPSISLRSIIQALLFYSNTPSGNGNPPYWLQMVLPFEEIETSEGGIARELRLSSTYINNINNWQFDGTSLYRGLLFPTGAEDLLDNIPEAINMLTEYLNTLDSNRYLAGVYSTWGDYSDFPEDWAAYRVFVKGNKYLKNLSDLLLARPIVVLTEEFITIARYMYECIKPIIGTGSLLDMLEYNLFTFEDYLAYLICGLLYSFNSGRSIYDFGLSGNYNDFVTDYPQSVLPLRAMYSIWYNNYRDQLIETKAVEVPTSNDASQYLISLLLPRLRCWQKDTFTTALDNAGTANAVVPVSYNSVDVSRRNPNASNADELNINMLDVYELEFRSGEKLRIPNGFISGLSNAEVVDVDDCNYFSLSMLDAAKRAQRFMQKALYFGNRIQDFMYVHFGVKHLDVRLRLPELIHSESSMVKLNVVTNNTTIASENTIAGDRSAVAYGEMRSGGFHRYCEEHGFIFGIMSIIPDISYSGGISREHSRLDVFDYPFPEFATLGMDAVYDVEICKRVVSKNPDGLHPKVFGYQGRYYDRKSRLSREHGELLDTQDMYTFARKFNAYSVNSIPRLNVRFVHCHPSLDMFVVDNELSDYFRFDVFNKVRADVQLPLYSIYLN